jgi:F-type H+-transporting ATPase subunit alpha
MKQLTAKYRLDYLQYRELVMLTKLNKSDLTKEIELRLKKGEIFTEVILQPQDAPVPFEEQTLIYYANNNDMLLPLTIDQVREFVRDAAKFARSENPGLLAMIRQEKKMTDKIKAGLEEVLKKYLSRFLVKAEEVQEAGVGAFAAAAPQKS